MKIFVALLRGINVGGSNPLPMKSLVAALEGLGASSVRTYIQSGNAVFHSAEKKPALLQAGLAAEIRKRHGFEPAVLVLELDELKQAMAGNPFPEAVSDPASLHLGFLAAVPANPDMKKLTVLKKASERFQLAGRVFYLHAPEGVGRSKLAAATERLLGVTVTDRNWRTVCKVVALAEG